MRSRGPSGRLKRELSRYCKVVTLDEFRTSKTCNCCKQCSLKNMRVRRWSEEVGRFANQSVHSVLHCHNSACPSMTMNRDVNASRNLLEIVEAQLAGHMRPAAFRR